MAVRDRIVERAGWWASPGKYRPIAEDLVQFFAIAKVKGGLSESLAQQSLDRLSQGVYFEKATASHVRHWCGIFACHVLAAVGVDVSWNILNGKMAGAGVTWRNTSKDMAPGDVAVITQGQHHFIITSVDAANNAITSVDGNRPGEFIEARTKQIRYTGTEHTKSIYGYYRIIQ